MFRTGTVGHLEIELLQLEDPPSEASFGVPGGQYGPQGRMVGFKEEVSAE